MENINPKVLEIGQMNIAGNVIPEAWFQNIVRPNGKAYITAIIILADILYWYRPTEVRDEHTGRVIQYKQKFKADMLQKSYSELSEKFGLGKKETTNAVIHLESMGLIKRVFRTVNKFPNVMFIDIFPQAIKEISILSVEQLIANMKKAEEANETAYISR